MALDEETWLPQAMQLARGEKKIVPHICGSGNKLIIENKEAGYSAWCYRCSDDGFKPHPKPSLAERIARLTAKKEAVEKLEADPRPPMPANFEARTWPTKAKLWLYKSGFDNDMIEAAGFYWCDWAERIVIPVLKDGKLIYWQARGFDHDLPKYINPKIDKPAYRIGFGPVTVITEDILSAVKVSTVTAAWSILGTSMPAAIAAELAALGNPVRVWLDPDEAGVKGRRRIVPQLRALGVDAKGIITDKDPKFYSSQEIREILCVSN